MPYYKLQPAIHGEYGIAAYPDIPVSVSFLAGRPIVEPLPEPLVFAVTNPSNRPPGHLVGTMIPVASKQFVHALNAAGVDNLQLFPAVLRNEANRSSWADYYAVNVIGLTDVVDESASQSDTIMEGDELPPLVDYRELVFAASKVRNLRLFRIVQSPIDVFISEDVRTALVEGRPPEGWGVSTTEVPVR